MPTSEYAGVMRRHASWAYAAGTALIAGAAMMIYMKVAHPFQLWAFLLVWVLVMAISRVVLRVVWSRRQPQ